MLIHYQSPEAPPPSKLPPPPPPKLPPPLSPPPPKPPPPVKPPPLRLFSAWLRMLPSITPVAPLDQLLPRCKRLGPPRERKMISAIRKPKNNNGSQKLAPACTAAGAYFWVGAGNCSWFSKVAMAPVPATRPP